MAAAVLYLFDLDGTLMTSEGCGRRAFDRACREVLGIERALDGVILHGNTDPLILAEACARGLDRPPSVAEAVAVIERYLACLDEELSRPGAVTVLPAVVALLDRLAGRGSLIGLATGNVEGGARRKLQAAGLWERFAFGGFGSDASERARLIEVAIGRAEQRVGRAIARQAVMVIGDTPRDIDAARAVGVRAVGVATGIHDAAILWAAGADEVHATLATFAP